MPDRQNPVTRPVTAPRDAIVSPTGAPYIIPDALDDAYDRLAWQVMRFGILESVVEDRQKRICATLHALVVRSEIVIDYIENKFLPDSAETRQALLEFC